MKKLKQISKNIYSEDYKKYILSIVKDENSILVAGGAGFIGINFVEYWSQNYKNDNIIVFDNLTYSPNKIFK